MTKLKTPGARTGPRFTADDNGVIEDAVTPVPADTAELIDRYLVEPKLTPETLSLEPVPLYVDVATLKPHVLADLIRVDQALVLKLEKSMREVGWLAGSIITLWEDMLLDGRHRVAAALLAGIEIPADAIRVYPAMSDTAGSQDAMRTVLMNNIDRRPWTPGQLAVLATEIANTKPGRPSKTASTDAVLFTQEQAMELVGLKGRSTITRTLKAKRNRPDLFEQIEAGTLAPERADRIMRDDETDRKRAKKAKQEAKVKSVPEPDIRLGAFQEVLADVPDGSVDIVLTDPPYPKEFLPLWSDLGEFAARVLKPGALCIAYSGHIFLDDVMTRLGEHLRYHWVVALETPGASANVYQSPFMPGWKPILVYTNGPIAEHYIKVNDDKPLPRSYDYIKSDASVTGNLHHWQQSSGPVEKLIENLTNRGDLVCDPFLGSGTTAVVAAGLLRRFVGAEIDPVAFETTRKRIAGLS